ncbi:MAG: hypothetical protein WBH47_11975, partial [Streptosporangiaceae bacterium]
MPRTARLTHALRVRGKTLAVGLGAVAALAGAGSASAVLSPGAITATHESAPAHAARVTAHHVSATPAHVVTTAPA